MALNCALMAAHVFEPDEHTNESECVIVSVKLGPLINLVALASIKGENFGDFGRNFRFGPQNFPKSHSQWRTHKIN